MVDRLPEGSGSDAFIVDTSDSTTCTQFIVVRAHRQNCLDADPAIRYRNALDHQSKELLALFKRQGSRPSDT